MARRRLRRFREIVESDLEILPLMNLFVVLIPMLLLSAVFLELSVIHMAAPGTDEQAEVEKEPFDLAVHISETSWEIRARDIETRVISRTEAGVEEVQGSGGAVADGAGPGALKDEGPAAKSIAGSDVMTSAIDIATAVGRLQAALIEIAVDHPDNKAVRIVSQPDTIYEDIIEVMDASRAAGLPEASLQAAGA